MAFLNESGLDRLWQNIIAKLNKKMADLDDNLAKQLEFKMDKENPSGIGSFRMNPDEGESVIGAYSSTLGFSNIATATGAGAEGMYTSADGVGSHSEGHETRTTGEYSHAEGERTEATGIASHAEGWGTKATGNYSHAEGYYAKSSAEKSHAEGYDTYAQGEGSHAEGYRTQATGEYSHAEGWSSSTSTSAKYSHAEGYDTSAYGENSHSEGYKTETRSINSHAEGRGTKASSSDQHVQGRYNIADENEEYAHIVGNGQPDYSDNFPELNPIRSNIHTLTWEGEGWFAGDVYVGSTSGTNKDEGSKKLVTENELTSLASSIEDLSEDVAYISDSNEDIAIDPDFPSSVAGTIHRFSVEVNCAPLKSVEPSIAPEMTDSYNPHIDYGVIIFPKTYTDHGKKTRLVIHCHGGGGKVDATTSQLEGQPISKYLVANGYAVMDVNGLPQTFATEQNLRIQDSVGSYIALQSYHKAYKYCMEKFNLEPEVFIMGISEGGITGANLCMEGVIPVLAHAAWSPVLDTYNQIFLKPWQIRVGPAKTLAVLYGFDPIDTTSKNDNQKWTYDEDKVRGYNPTTNHTITIDGTSYKQYPCPVKFWHCMDDTTVSYSGTENFIQAIKNAGGIAYLRTFETGGHEIKLIGDPIENPLGATEYIDGSTIEVKLAMDETLLWFKRFE